MSFASYRLRCLGSRCVSTNFARQFTVASAHRQSQILSEERLQTLVDTLEKPLKIEDNTTVLLEAIESLQPKKNILKEKEYEKMYNLLDKSYNRKQIAEYLASKQMHWATKSKKTKKNMVETLLKSVWNIKTDSELREEKRRRVTKHFPATRQELFFIIGDNGDMLRSIEVKNQVGITIDVSKNEYSLEGQPKAVEKAKEDIKLHLKITEGYEQVPMEIRENKQLQLEVVRLLTDVSKASGSYISLKEDNFIFSSLSQDTMDNAKRMLKLALTDLKITGKNSLSEADKIMAQSKSQFLLMPFYDPRSMSAFNQQFGWSRFKKTNNKGSELEFTDLAHQKSSTLNGLNNILLEDFDEGERKDILLEARLGHVLCKNPTKHKMTPNLLQPESKGIVDFKELADLYKYNRTQFFNAMPPFPVLQYLSPLVFEQDFFQRSIKVEYVNNALLAAGDSQDCSGLSRLELEFNVERHGDMTLKSIFGEKKRSVINVLGISDCIDAQIAAKHNIECSDVQELATNCHLLGYNDLRAPIHYKDMTLLDISYMDKKKYVHKDTLLSVNRVEEQDSKLKRTELLISSNKSMSDPVQRWESFVDTLTKLLKEWKL